MKTTLPWILAGVGAGVATYLMIRQQQDSPQFASSTGSRFRSGAGTGYDAVDDAADRTATWGDKQRLAGAGTNLVGKVKESFGRVTGNDSLAAEGTADQAAGSIRNATGTVANAAGQTIKDLNF